MILEQLFEIVNERIRRMISEIQSIKIVENIDPSLQEIIDKIQLSFSNIEILSEIDSSDLKKLSSICGENYINNLIIYIDFLKDSLNNPNLKFKDQSIEKLQNLCANIIENYNKYKETSLSSNSEYQILIEELDQMKKLIRKLKNSYDITSDDIDVLCKTLKEEGCSDDKILNYITYIMYGFMEKIENQELYNIEEEQLEEISLEEMTLLFAKYGYDFNLLKSVDQNKMLKKCNIENVRNILETLKNENIDLNDKYGSNTILIERSRQLVELFIHSKPNLVLGILKTAQNDIKLFKNGKVDFALLIERPSIFIEKKRTINKIKEGPGGGTNPSDNIIGCYEDFINNVDLIKNIYIQVYGTDKGFDAFFRQYKHKCVFEAPYQKTLNVVNTFKMYKVDPSYYIRALSSFVTNDQADTLDTYLELDCYEYIKCNPSKFSNHVSTAFFSDIAVAKLNGMDNKALFRVQNRSNPIGQISSTYIVLNQAKLDNFVKGNNLKFKKFTIDDNFDDINKTVIEEFERCVTSNGSNNNLIFSKKVLNDPNVKTMLKSLEQYVDPEDDLVYNIEGIRISKNKVLRLYTILKLNDFEETMEIMLYIITRNSYLTQEQFEIIKSELMNKKEKKI